MYEVCSLHTYLTLRRKNCQYLDLPIWILGQAVILGQKNRPSNDVGGRDVLGGPDGSGGLALAVFCDLLAQFFIAEHQNIVNITRLRCLYETDCRQIRIKLGKYPPRKWRGRGALSNLLERAGGCCGIGRLNPHITYICISLACQQLFRELTLTNFQKKRIIL